MALDLVEAFLEKRGDLFEFLRKGLTFGEKRKLHPRKASRDPRFICGAPKTGELPGSRIACNSGMRDPDIIGADELLEVLGSAAVEIAKSCTKFRGVAV